MGGSHRIRPFILSRLLLLGVGLFLAACQYDPHAKDYLLREPTLAEVAGTYRVDFVSLYFSLPQSEKEIEARKDCVLSISPDGAVRFTGLPWIEEDSSFRYSFHGFRDGTARARVDSVGSVANGSGKAKTFYGLVFTDLPSGLASARLLGDSHSVTGILFGIGDPDGGEAIRFVRVADARSGDQLASRH